MIVVYNTTTGEIKASFPADEDPTCAFASGRDWARVDAAYKNFGDRFIDTGLVTPRSTIKAVDFEKYCPKCSRLVIVPTKTKVAFGEGFSVQVKVVDGTGNDALIAEGCELQVCFGDKKLSKEDISLSVGVHDKALTAPTEFELVTKGGARNPASIILRAHLKTKNGKILSAKTDVYIDYTETDLDA